ncbi:MAG: PQQ-binding-like beta-propeller repeat protein [Planctomycetes bacterium]|nr:PQQ-binding-like beta-propeller repeat protein [Planctomycetota bacterium]
MASKTCDTDLTARTILVRLFLFSFFLFNANIFGADWPTWRHDASRTGASPDGLPPDLQLQWVREFPPLEPAWPDQDRLMFDLSYEPVVLGKTLFFGSSLNDCLIALDTETGDEKWKFYADGPIRFAPAACEGKVYFVCDDGCLYCLSAQTGELIWKFNAAPAVRPILGNRRLISTWPARGAPAIADGKVYFSAGIWPFMGIFVYALDAATGKVVWINDGAGAIYQFQPHESPAFAGIAPQGYMTVSGGKLLVPNGRAVPACFNRETGKLQYFHLAANGKNGFYFSATTGRFFFNGAEMYDCETGYRIMISSLGATPVLTEQAAFSLRNGAITANDIQDVQIVESAARTTGKVDKRMFQLKSGEKGLNTLWQAEQPGGVTAMIAAGARLYAGSPNSICAINVPKKGEEAAISWTAEIRGTPATLLAADDKLFAVTLEGRVYCFGKKKGEAKAPASGEKKSSPQGEWGAKAAMVLKQTGITDGYAVVAGNGRLAEELARQSNLHVIFVEPDQEKRTALRKDLDAAGLYGRRASVFPGDPAAVDLPPYLASLMVFEVAPVVKTGAEDASVRKIFDVLRPYGGTAWFFAAADQRQSLTRWINDAKLPCSETADVDGALVLKRVGAIPGSADWTHQYADPANTAISRDKYIKAPLGILWFGGSENEKILPKHGHGPSPQVVGGRLFIEGQDMLRALDVYTGRILWETALKNLGKFFDSPLHMHQPGANSIGSNYVSLEDEVYVVHGKKCLRLDSRSGKTLSEFMLPAIDGSDGEPEWGQIRICDNILLAASIPMRFDRDPFFSLHEADKIVLTPGNSDVVLQFFKQITDFAVIPKDKNEKDKSFFQKNLNKLLLDPSLSKNISNDVKAKAKPETIAAIQSEIDRLLADDARRSTDAVALPKLNRSLLEACLSQIPKKDEDGPGGFNRDSTVSRELVAMDRNSGKVLWKKPATYSLFHNGVAAGKGMVFCIDRWPDSVQDLSKRQGRKISDGGVLSALELRTGKVVWSTDKGVFGTWLGYSEKNDILIQAGRPTPDMLSDEPKKIAAYRGKDGKLLWENPNGGSGVRLLCQDMIVTAEGGVSLISGEAVSRKNPLTNGHMEWKFKRFYGCNHSIGSEHLILFRSAAAGFYDLERNGGTGNFGGFKSGCTSNLIPANGVLSAPDYTRLCACSYQNQCSLALIRMPEAEMWTFNDFVVGDEPIARIGVNLGAPGDRMADDSTLWLEYPVIGGPSPEIKISISPENAQPFLHHSARMSGEGLKWVAASGIAGIRSFALSLAQDDAKARPYTVRLYFAEPDEVKADERVFSISVQDQIKIEDLDIVRETGGPRRLLVKELKGINVKGELKITFTPKNGAALICGVEAIAE